jgi:hypothetical protein
MAPHKKLAFCTLVLLAIGMAGPAGASEAITERSGVSTLPSWLPKNHQPLVRDRLYFDPAATINTTTRDLPPRFNIPGHGCSALAVAVEIGGARPARCAAPGAPTGFWDWIALDLSSWGRSAKATLLIS